MLRVSFVVFMFVGMCMASAQWSPAQAQGCFIFDGQAYCDPGCYMIAPRMHRCEQYEQYVPPFQQYQPEYNWPPPQQTYCDPGYYPVAPNVCCPDGTVWDGGSRCNWPQSSNQQYVHNQFDGRPLLLLFGMISIIVLIGVLGSYFSESPSTDIQTYQQDTAQAHQLRQQLEHDAAAADEFIRRRIEDAYRRGQSGQ